MAKKRAVRAEDLYDLQQISGCALGPDGQAVMFAVQRVEKEGEKKVANLWLASATGQAKQFTFGNQSDTAPQFSPDGRWVAFLSNRGNGEKPAQIYLIPTDGGEARPLTTVKGTIGSFQWAANGRSLVCAVRKTDQDVLAQEADERKKKLGVVARHITRVHYKYDGTGFLPQERWHIWTVDVPTGKARQLTDSPIHDELSPAWSPDGQHIVFVSNRAADPDFAPDGEDLYVISAGGGEMRPIPTPYGPVSQPVYSPNGRWIAYFGREGRGDWWKNTHLWLVPGDGSAPAHCLTAAYDFDVANDTINDLGSGWLESPTWSPDSERLYFQVSRHGRVSLHTIRRHGTDFQTVIDEEGTVGGYTLDQSGRKIAYWYASMTHPGEIWLLDTVLSKTKPLTRLHAPYLRAVELGEVEEVWFKGSDQNDLQGWILKPAGFDPGQSYPSILEIHGGPLGQYGYAFMHEFYFLAAHGYVVYFSNPRGGQGYGEAHARAIWNGHGTVDYEDVLAWADYVAQLPYIDPARRGVTGGSYGGFMVNWIIGHTHQFKAAVTQRSISNRLSSYGSSDINWLRELAFNDEPPWENLENYWEQSPLKYVGNAKTPTLVIHSEQDLRCPIEQGEQMFVALKRLGVDTEMVRFPDSPHGLSRVGRTDRRIARLNHILRWFDRYLK